MNEYLVSPVTPIVISVVAIAVAIFVITTVRSRRKKRAAEKERERRAMEARVAAQLEAERRSARARERREDANPNRTSVRELQAMRALSQKGQPLRRSRLQDSTTTSSSSRRYDPSTDSLMQNAALFGVLGGQDDSSRNEGSHRDTDSSHSYWGDKGSSHGSGHDSSGHSGGGSSDSGGSSSGGDSGGGGGGGCD